MTSELAPLPGDPTALKSKADELASSATQIQQAITQLRRLADNNDTVSEAVDKVRSKASDLANNITQAHIRYSGTAQALQEYAPKLEAAQQRAQRAITAHDAAQQQVANAQASQQQQAAQYKQDQATKAAQASSSSSSSTAEPPQAFNDTPAGVKAAQGLSDANDSVANALSEYQAATAELDTAAQQAISKINSAMDDSHLNDSGWDKLKHLASEVVHEMGSLAKKYLAPILDVVQQIAAKLSDVLGWISLVVSIVAVFCPILAPLAAALDVATLALAALSFLTTLALVGFGDRTWGDVISTGITVVLSALPYAKVVGKAGSKLTEVADDVAQPAIKRLGAKLAGKGLKGLSTSMDKADKFVSAPVEKLSKMVGEHGAALGKVVSNKKIEGLAHEAAGRVYQRARNHGLDDAEAAAKMFHAEQALKPRVAELVGNQWAKKTEDVTGKVLDTAYDGLKDTVKGNATNALDHYVFDQEDHHPSGIEINEKVPITSPSVDFVSQEGGLEKPSFNPGAFDPAAHDWNPTHWVDRVPTGQTAELEGAK